ncbi:DUF805 domain-containing protein [Gymnodinialimonas hymeniacidonis]|uniref:DUF805 domain-containing protein n=1 Tax=Gymnodinialimonas hymeniacidonis TaxID=3126508 RepID=UPI0034C5D6FD
MTFGEAISHNIRNMFRFSGRDPRSAFWWYVLFVIVGSVVANAIDAALLLLRADSFFNMMETIERPEEFLELIAGNPWIYFTFAPVTIIWSIVNILPLFSCGIRRRHDCDKSGTAFAIITLVALVSTVVATIYMFQFFGEFMDFALASAQDPNFAASPFDDDEALTSLLRFMGIASFLSLAQFAAGIIILIMMATKGTNGPNRFGEDPLA